MLIEAYKDIFHYTAVRRFFWKPLVSVFAFPDSTKRLHCLSPQLFQFYFQVICCNNCCSFFSEKKTFENVTLSSNQFEIFFAFETWNVTTVAIQSVSALLHLFLYFLLYRSSRNRGVGNKEGNKVGKQGKVTSGRKQFYRIEPELKQLTVGLTYVLF